MVRLRRRYRKVIYSIDKSPMEMIFWNICRFEQLHRELVRWLDENIPEGGKIRSIERLDAFCGWVRVKNDKDVRVVMFGPHDISLIVVMS